MSAALVYLTFEEAAEIARVKPSTVRWWCTTGRLTRYKPGRHPLVKREELLAFIDGTAVTAVN